MKRKKVASNLLYVCAAMSFWRRCSSATDVGSLYWNELTADFIFTSKIFSKRSHSCVVEIGLFYGEQKRLPVDEISNWLEPSADGTKNNIQNQTERFLRIYYSYYLTPFIQNGREMLEYLIRYILRHLHSDFFVISTDNELNIHCQLNVN